MLEHLWVEKYRPQTLDEVVLPPKEKQKLQEYLNQKRIPHLAFQGPPGTGKSTIARIIKKTICQSSDDYIDLNASLHGRIDTIRTVILPFLKTPPLASPQKIVYFEEFDNTSPEAQLALREPIESGSKHTAFILTFNYINRVDDAILSRMQIFTVSAPPFEQCIERCEFILQQENVKYNKSDIEKLVAKFYPHLRDIIKMLQKLTVNGVFEYDESMVLNEFDEIVNQVKFILTSKFRDYKTLRKNLQALIRYIAKSYVDLASVMKQIASDDEIPIEIRIKAGGFIDQIARSIAPESTFMFAVGELLNVKAYLEQQGLL